MDIMTLANRLLQSLNNPNSAKSLGSAPDIPIKILETVIPGYSTVARFFLVYFRFDVSRYVSFFAFLYAFNEVRKYLWRKIYDNFRYYLTSTVHIDGGDDLYEHVIRWFAAKRPDISARYVTAKTQTGSAEQEDDEDAEALTRAAVDNQGNFNFSKWAARVPPRYEPHHGAHWFWHTYTDILLFDSSSKLKRSEDGQAQTVIEQIDISCVGRNTEPIKRLLAEIKLWSVNKSTPRTVIRSPSSIDHGWWRHPWKKASERPCRPLDTVILDPAEKRQIIKDMNEFLHPASPKWYATRGIPYRRGYLFHGPPGTGKTSLSFALAGIFGLEIFIIPLMDSQISEAYLNRLFNELPKRCIVLLEDIDTAGVQRDEDSDVEDDEDQSSEEKKDESKSKTRGKGKGRGDKSEEKKDEAAEKPDATDAEKTASEPTATTSTEIEKQKDKGDETDPDKVTLRDLAKAITSATNSDNHSSGRKGGGRRGRSNNNDNQSQKEPKSNISLSGLLNVIDGIATHEGRILIMTTNHPDKLDAALVRTGRVDMQVKFTYATKLQMRYLFMRMYVGDIDGTAASSRGPQYPSTIIEEDSASEEAAAPDAVELRAISEEFAELLPEETFAPSDIQGYLLMHKKKPRDALEKVEEWREGRIKEIAKMKAKKRRAEARALRGE